MVSKKGAKWAKRAFKITGCTINYDAPMGMRSVAKDLKKALSKAGPKLRNLKINVEK